MNQVKSYLYFSLFLNGEKSLKSVSSFEVILSFIFLLFCLYHDCSFEKKYSKDKHEFTLNLITQN